MPMNFPDLKSLNIAAKTHQFRKILKDETEEEYRVALANHVKPRDLIESYEIRFSLGWDEWTDTMKAEMLRAQGLGL